jgi:hypothetical protein
LKEAGLVRDRHEGRRTHYSAQLGALAPLIDWTSRMGAVPRKAGTGPGAGGMIGPEWGHGVP